MQISISIHKMHLPPNQICSKERHRSVISATFLVPIRSYDNTGLYGVLSDWLSCKTPIYMTKANEYRTFVGLSNIEYIKGFLFDISHSVRTTYASILLSKNLFLFTVCTLLNIRYCTNILSNSGLNWLRSVMISYSAQFWVLGYTYTVNYGKYTNI